MMKIRAVIALAASAGMALTLSAQQAGTAAAAPPAVMEIKGKAFPDIKMKTLAGKEFTNKNFEKKVTVIDFWATWCGPCVAAAPKLQKMHEEMADKGVQIIGANGFERGEGGKIIDTPDNAKKYVEEHKYTYTFTYGNTELAKSLKITGIPTFFVIDGKGIVRDVMVGFNEANLRKSVDTILAEQN